VGKKKGKLAGTITNLTPSFPSFLHLKFQGKLPQTKPFYYEITFLSPAARGALFEKTAPLDYPQKLFIS
jgi:hypothetical protein